MKDIMSTDSHCRFIVDGEVIAKQRPRVSMFGGFARAYTPEKTKTYENYVKLCYQTQIGGIFAEKGVPVQCCIRIHKLPLKTMSKKKTQLALCGGLQITTRPDLDNCVKSILDGLNKIAYEDDGQICSLYVDKVFDKEEYVEVVLTKVETTTDIIKAIRGFTSDFKGV